MLELFVLFCLQKKTYYFICWLVFILCRFVARNPTSQLTPFLLGGGGGGGGVGVERMVERERMPITRRKFAYDQNNP